MKKGGSRIRIGNVEDVMKADNLRKAFTEFFCVLVFIFSAEGYVLYFSRIVPELYPPPPANQQQDYAQFLGTALTHAPAPNPPPASKPQDYAQFLGTALTHGFGLMVAVAFGMNISGGHSNPAVTFGAFLGGHITLINTILYSIAQCLGGFAALGILKFASNGLMVIGWGGTTPWQGIKYMIPMVFFLTYAYYATIFDTKRGKNKEAIAPFVIGFICVCNVMSGGGIFGGAMNPAMALCVAAFSNCWNNHQIYWVGSYAGAALAALVYQIVNGSDDDVDSVYEQLPVTAKPVADDEDTYKQLLITKP